MRPAIVLAASLATIALPRSHGATLLEDNFDGPDGSPPDAAGFEWHGEVALNGSGELSLQTWSLNESWLRSRASARPDPGRAVVFRMRAYAYAEHWNPGVYGNQQPRGLRAGTGPDECAEFFTVTRTRIGMRVRNDGSESVAELDLPSGVDSMHDYEITLVPGSALFTIDGAVAATFDSNVPDASLNVHASTTDGGAGNVPVTIDSLSLATRSTLPVLLTGETFGGTSDAPPDAHRFEWGGEVRQDGAGTIQLLTQSVDHSWLRSRASFAPGAGQILRFAANGAAYAEEHWTPGVYGDRQPRGLRVGNDPDNAAEFFSASLNEIGARVCRNGVESSTSVAIPGGVNRMTSLEVLVSPEAAVFLVDGSPVATFNENIPDGPLNIHCSTDDGGGVGNVPVSFSDVSLSLFQDPPILLVNDEFDGIAGTLPDPAAFAWSGEVTRDGVGRLALRTWAVPSSSLRTVAGAMPTATRHLVFAGRMSAALAGGGVVGDGQARGLRVGDDPDEVVEFHSLSPTSVGMRCRRDGVESSASTPLPDGVAAMHDYEIRVGPAGAVFSIDGDVVGTISDNLPEGPLNAFVSTDDGGAENVPVLIDSLSLSVVQPAPAITAITPYHGVPGSTVVIDGSGFLDIDAVSFAGIPAVSFTVESDSRILAVVPEGVTTGPVTVSTAGGSSDSTTEFILMEPQSISFDPLDDVRIDSPDFELSAAASSGLQVEFESSDPSIAAITGQTVTLFGRGSVMITATQPGNDHFLPAAPVARELYVTGLPPVIDSTFPATPEIASVAEGDPLALTVAASDPEPGDVLSYSWFLSNDGGETWMPAPVSGHDVIIPVPHETVVHPATSLDGGMARVKVVVSDPYRGEDSHVWTATSVTDRNRLPRFDRPLGSGAWGWRPTHTAGAPPPRVLPTEIWTGSRMIVWGGNVGPDSPVGTGGLYDPLTDRWKPVATSGAPESRMDHTAVWSGSNMIVWGGDRSGWSYSMQRLDTGGIYDPVTDQWTAITTTDAPLARGRHTSVWTGDRMIVWGGTINTGSYYTTATDTGGIYDPQTDSWTAVTTTGAPERRFSHIAVWTGDRMLVVGGWKEGPGSYVGLNSGGLYDPELDQWTPISTTNAPPPSNGAVWNASWTGTRLIVWGGANGGTPLQQGWSYEPASDQWSPISTEGAPQPRTCVGSDGNAVWADGHMLAWGGIVSGTDWTSLVSGGLYDPATDSWQSMEMLDAPSGRWGNALAWCGDSAVVWGGQDATTNQHLQTGGVYAPAPEPVISPAAPVPGQELVCTAGGTVVDPDEEDQPGLMYEFTWMNGTTVHSVETQADPSCVLPAGTTSGGESWGCRVRVFDSSGGATPSGGAPPVTIDDSPLAAWMSASFTPEQLNDPAVSGMTACPAGDGIPNLMKFALAIPPMECGSDRLPVASAEDDHLVFTFRQNKDAAGLTFTVEVSDELDGSFSGTTPTEISRIDKGDHWQVTVRDNQPVSASPTRFMRLRVEP